MGIASIIIYIIFLVVVLFIAIKVIKKAFGHDTWRHPHVEDKGCDCFAYHIICLDFDFVVGSVEVNCEYKQKATA